MKKTFCFDLDNVICTTIGNNYSKSKPKKKVINCIRILFNKGHRIKIFTARHMGKFNGDSQKAKKYGYQKTRNQLKKWKVKYHELIMGKPSYDIFIDDKALGFNKNWTKKLKKYY